MTAGTVYLLHFDQPYRHARHYLGWTADLAARLADHAAGRGARLLAVVRAAGIGWRLARTWAGTRALERRLKRQGGASRRCPLCGVRPRTPAAPPPPAPTTRPAAVAVASRPPARERGAAAARRIIGGYLAAGLDREQAGAAAARMLADFDPATARPAALELYRGWSQAAAALLDGPPAAPAA